VSSDDGPYLQTFLPAEIPAGDDVEICRHMRRERGLTPQLDDGSAIQATLKDMTGQTTVPNIFIAQKHIGGNSHLQGKKSELPSLLKEAGAV
jgi:glutaredoxin-related protein